MMSSPMIRLDAKCLKIHEFFQTNYIIPQFQRGYAWNDAQVKLFMEDIYEFFDGVSLSKNIYLLGQVIVAPAEEIDSRGNEKYDLVDGQQRATTILLFLIVLYKRFTKIPNWHANETFTQHIHNLKNLIQYTNIVNAGSIDKQLRIKDVTGGSELIQALLDKDDANPNFPGVDVAGWTRKNIFNAYKQIKKFVDLKEPDDDRIPMLYYRFVNELYLVRLELPTTDLAVHVFERINNRGMPLNSADLLKNVIFSKINQNDDDYKYVSERWKIAGQILYTADSSRLRHVEYLLKAIILQYITEPVSNAEVLKKWRERIQNREIAMQLADRISVDAQKLHNIDKGKYPNDDAICIINQGSKYFEIVQHFPILFAGSHLTKTNYELLASYVEDRAIISLLSKERPQDFEKIVPKWCSNIHQLSSTCTPQDITNASQFAFDEVVVRLDIVKTNFMSLRYAKQSDRARIRYILARISRKIDKDSQLSGALPPLNEYLHASQKTKGVNVLGYDIEHVRPVSKYGDLDLTHSIGNLVLAHPQDQRNASNLEPSEKHQVYSSSRLLLTKSLCEEKVIYNSLRKTEVDSLHDILHKFAPPSLSDWNDITIQQRANMYWELFKLDINSPIKLDISSPN